MTNPYRERLLGIGIVSATNLGDSRSKTYRHPEEGYLMKDTKTGGEDVGHVIHTEHAKGDRIDADVHPKTLKLKVQTEK